MLIIDEVLAVGDAEFQRKCLGAMRDVSRKGRTTLFVSHNMSAVSSLCNRVIWLDRGTVRGDGAPDHVIHDYLLTGYTELGTEQASVDLRERPRGWCAGTARVDSVTFRRHSGSYQRRPWHVAFGESFDLVLECAIDRPESEAIIAIGFRNDRGEDVLTSHSCDSGRALWPDCLTRGTAAVEISQPWLRPGRYFVEVAILSGMRLLDFVSDAAVLVVDEQPAPGAPPLPLKKGPVSPVWTWTIDGDGGPAVG